MKRKYFLIVAAPTLALPVFTTSCNNKQLKFEIYTSESKVNSHINSNNYEAKLGGHAESDITSIVIPIRIEANQDLFLFMPKESSSNIEFNKKEDNTIWLDYTYNIAHTVDVLNLKEVGHAYYGGELIDTCYGNDYLEPVIERDHIDNQIIALKMSDGNVYLHKISFDLRIEHFVRVWTKYDYILKKIPLYDESRCYIENFQYELINKK